jgi:hypothetical protein
VKNLPHEALFCANHLSLKENLGAIRHEPASGLISEKKNKSEKGSKICSHARVFYWSPPPLSPHQTTCSSPSCRRCRLHAGVMGSRDIELGPGAANFELTRSVGDQFPPRQVALDPCAAAGPSCFDSICEPSPRCCCQGQDRADAHLISP